MADEASEATEAAIVIWFRLLNLVQRPQRKTLRFMHWDMSVLSCEMRLVCQAITFGNVGDRNKIEA